MTLNRNFNFVILLTILFSCRNTKTYTPSIGELNSKKYVKVSLQELFENKELYHGQIIETEGYYHFGFEESAIYLENEFTSQSTRVSLKDSTMLFPDACGIWIEFNINHPFYQHYPDSLSHQLVVVKGLFDTTKTGHVGGCYRAALTHTFGMNIARKEN